jgi:hypothetical protein
MGGREYQLWHSDIYFPSITKILGATALEFYCVFNVKYDTA